MLTTLKGYVRTLLRDCFVWDLIQRKIDGWKIYYWEKNGKLGPPPHAVKRRILSSFAEKYGANTLIETGTFLGDMVYAMRSMFQTIYSIELSVDLVKKAKRRFRSYPHIQILAGDSGKILPQILAKVRTPCLFWLDGHYSGGITAMGETECPIINELTSILEHNTSSHIILIDDARCFDGTSGYPTLDELQNLVINHGSKYEITAADDVIRICPVAKYM